MPPQTAPTPARDSTGARHRKRTSGALGYFIFASRWLQAPLYIGLIVAQLVYVVVFMIDLWHLIETVFHDITELNESTIMLSVLGLIDVVMIANLLIMVIMGGYEIFVSKLRINDHPDQPDWLNHVNANVLKVKLAISIISISSIHLLRTFIEVGDIGARTDESVTGETYTSEGCSGRSSSIWRSSYRHWRSRGSTRSRSGIARSSPRRSPPAGRDRFRNGTRCAGRR